MPTLPCARASWTSFSLTRSAWRGLPNCARLSRQSLSPASTASMRAVAAAEISRRRRWTLAAMSITRESASAMSVSWVAGASRTERDPATVTTIRRVELSLAAVRKTIPSSIESKETPSSRSVGRDDPPGSSSTEHLPKAQAICARWAGGAVSTSQLILSWRPTRKNRNSVFRTATPPGRSRGVTPSSASTPGVTAITALSEAASYDRAEAFSWV